MLTKCVSLMFVIHFLIFSEIHKYLTATQY